LGIGVRSPLVQGMQKQWLLEGGGAKEAFSLPIALISHCLQCLANFVLLPPPQIKHWITIGTP